MTPPTCTLRRGTSRDLDAVYELEYRCFGAADVFPRRAWRRLLGPSARRRSAITLVAETPPGAEGGRRILAVATGLLRANSRVLRLYSLAVDPQARGQGLGRRLIAELVAAAPRRLRVLSLEVRTGNASARALYESLGLRAVCTQPGYYPDGGDGVRYRAPFSALILAPARG